MKVYEVLRDGLLEDKLISGQPAFAKEHLKKVPTWCAHLPSAV